MADLDQIKKVLASRVGKALKEHLIGKLQELQSIENLKEVDGSEGIAIEVKGQKKAYTKLKEILVELITFEEEQKEKDPRDSFHVE